MSRQIETGREADVAARDLRLALLGLVERDYPAVLAALDEVVAPAYETAPAVTAAHRPATTAALERWGREAWRIPAPRLLPSWLREVALLTIDAWRLQPDAAPRGRAWAPRAMLGWWPEPRPYRFEVPGWHYDGTEGAADAYVEAVAEAARRAARVHVAEVKAQAAAAGWRPADRHPAALGHLAWLGRYQLGGESYAQIAKAPHGGVNVVRQSVADAVKRIADDVGLPLRSAGSAGRPRRPP